MTHEFILKPGIWIGQGKITFTASPDSIKFFTKWQITEEIPGILRAVQKVEMEGINDHVVNYFLLENITTNGFSITIENELMGKINGKGIIEENVIAWEFRGQVTFDGFEVYELKENGDYSFHAEYASTDQFRTIVDGLIWKKGDS
ncbi:MAG: hypothetical protein H0W88_02545 [Parachlamydiaceae bacterium]|nr:hypothetical protein [Parachlamydiaceae bacterium]